MSRMERSVPTSVALEEEIIGTSRMLKQALALARQFAPSGLPVLLVGATGTGKELFAREIHRCSGLPGTLVEVNCAALPREMVEGLLFGHRRGAFTGAHDDSVGLVEAADRGTLFLDELTSLPIEAQPKLLRFLEQGEVRRLGETRKRTVQLRVIAAAQPDVFDQVRDGSMRMDLLHRLAGAVIQLPTLAERRQDIAELATHFARRAGCQLEPEALGLLTEYDWPGNVRELRMVVVRAACLSGSPFVPSAAVVAALRAGMLSRPAAAVPMTDREDARRRMIAHCAQHHWNVAACAEALGIGRTTFFKELRLLGISLRGIKAHTERRFEASSEFR